MINSEMRITEPYEISRETHIFSRDPAWFNNSHFENQHLALRIAHLTFSILHW